MGWERKSGKVSEFNRVVAGVGNAAFSVTTGCAVTLHGGVGREWHLSQQGRRFKEVLHKVEKQQLSELASREPRAELRIR